MERILIADPSPAMRSWLRAALLSGPAVAEEVDCAWDLLTAAADGPFDLIVCARLLPGMSGHQVLATLRTAGLATPFVLLAPFARERLRSLVHRVGHAVIVDDPFDATELRGTVARLLAPDAGALAIGG